MDNISKTIILNLLPVHAGGGLQNALSFIETVACDSLLRGQVKVVCNLGSRIHQVCCEDGINCIPIAANKIARLNFEMNCKARFTCGLVCFTFFGPPMLNSQNHLINVVGCAYSNLFYPEIPFWSYMGPINRGIKYMNDMVRKKAVARGDYWIFETGTIRKRAVQLFGFPEYRANVVRMAPSNLISRDRIKPELRSQIQKKLPEGFKVLYLSGAHPNKRQHLLYKIASYFWESGLGKLVFVTTMDSSSLYAKSVMQPFEKNGLQKAIYNIGPIAPEDVSTVIDCCDAMCTFSLLESFSNNFVEAWKMGRPLLVTDADWARDACGNAALYMNPEDAKSSAIALFSLTARSDLLEQLVTNGERQLSLYPTPREKNLQYIEHIEKARSLGFCKREERLNIHWTHHQTFSDANNPTTIHS